MSEGDNTSERNADKSTTKTVGSLTNRHYIARTNRGKDHKSIRQQAQQGTYRLDQIMARGAESVLYTGNCAGQQVCIKAVRNNLNKWIGDSTTRSQEEKLDSVSYRTKVRHITNEYEIAKLLYNDGDVPVVHIYALRKVKCLGIELGYDLIMELLHGHDLADKILSKTLTLEDKMNVFVQAVQALSYIHKRKLIHLDIKPSNFMLNNGHVKLIDFGVSVMNGYKPQAITGTGGYLSPEQICKETLDEATDIFALGLTFGVFFGGKALHQPQSDLLMKQTRLEAKYHLEQDNIPVIAELPELQGIPKFAEIIRNCTIPRRDMRTSNCQVLLSQLRAWANETGTALEFT